MKYPAFTAIEVIFIIVVLGIVSIFAIVATSPARRLQETSTSAERTEVKEIAKAFSIYLSQHNGEFPLLNGITEIGFLDYWVYDLVINDYGSCIGYEVKAFPQIHDYYPDEDFTNTTGLPYYVFGVKGYGTFVCTTLPDGSFYYVLE